MLTSVPRVSPQKRYLAMAKKNAKKQAGWGKSLYDEDVMFFYLGEFI